MNDSFPPLIDGVANAVFNYARFIEQDHAHSLVMTPQVPGSDDSKYDFSVVRYPSIDTRKLFGYVTGYPFSPEAAHEVEAQNVSLLHTHCPVTSCLLARQLAEAYDLPLVLTWHTKYDIDIANAVKNKLLQESARQALLLNVNACDEIWTVSKGAGENLRSLGFEGEYIVMPATMEKGQYADYCLEFFFEDKLKGKSKKGENFNFDRLQNVKIKKLGGENVEKIELVDISIANEISETSENKKQMMYSIFQNCLSNDGNVNYGDTKGGAGVANGDDDDDDEDEDYNF